MTPSPSRLSTRDQNVILLVTRFRQVAASHIQRLYFSDGSPASRGRRQRRVCTRLVKWGALSRLPRPIGGMGGSDGYVYLPAGSKTRIADPHTLDIIELFVRLHESGVKILSFQPEPYCHINVGHLELKPDTYVKLETDVAYLAYWLEVDRGTEYRPQLHAKMRRYCQAFEKWGEGLFPKVVFIVSDQLRFGFIEGVIKKQETPGLFSCVLMPNAIPYLIGE